MRLSPTLCLGILPKWQASERAVHDLDAGNTTCASTTTAVPRGCRRLTTLTALRLSPTTPVSRCTRSRSTSCGRTSSSWPALRLTLSFVRIGLRLKIVPRALTDVSCLVDDRRMIRAPMLRDWGIAPPSDPSSSSLTQCVRRFGVPHPSTPHKGEISHHIVAAKLSPDNPRDLLLSYSSAGIYLFDTDGETYERPPPPPSASKHSKGKQRAAEDSEEDEHEHEDAEGATRAPDQKPPSAAPESPMSTPAQLFGVHEHKRSAKKRGAGRSAESSTGELPQKRLRDEGSEVGVEGGEGQVPTSEPVEHEDLEERLEVLQGGSGAGGDADESEDSSDQEELMDDSDDVGDSSARGEGEEDDEDATDEEGGEEEEDFLPRGRRREYHADVPMVAPHQSYTGHANTQVRLMRQLAPVLPETDPLPLRRRRSRTSTSSTTTRSSRVRTTATSSRGTASRAR